MLTVCDACSDRCFPVIWEPFTRPLNPYLRDATSVVSEMHFIIFIFMVHLIPIVMLYVKICLQIICTRLLRLHANICFCNSHLILDIYHFFFFHKLVIYFPPILLLVRILAVSWWCLRMLYRCEELFRYVLGICCFPVSLSYQLGTA